MATVEVECKPLEESENKAEKEVEIEERTPETKEDTKEEFQYLQRNEFTSEIYKIEIRGLGYFGVGELKKLLKNKLQLNISKVKSPKGKEFAFVGLRSAEDQERALKVLNGYKWRGRELQACTAKASADPLVLKRRHAEENEGNGKADAAKKPRSTVEATCPLATMPYEEQLQQKTSEMQAVLQKFSKELCRTNPEAKPHMDAFKFQGVLPSPQVTGYRNKNEFTVGKNSDGEIVVGFRLSSYADGCVEVSDVQTANLPHLSESAKWAARSFQEFVRACAKELNFQAFNPAANSGHFRQLMVRNSTETGEIMLVAGIYSSNLTSEQLEVLKERLKAFYALEAESKEEFRCSSLYYQDVKQREAGQLVSPVEHLAGTTHISDTIHGLKFRISPLAFFQINTAGANVLYTQAIELAAPQAHTCLLDICCGTGTIGLSFAKHCKRVLGVDIVADAIEDAQINARANDIENCRFYAGNADDYIQSLVREAVYSCAPGEPFELIAVVDPPRNGLHTRSITNIRGADPIKRLVYISCNPARAQRNWVELCRPESKQYKGEPFYPKTAVAVDMFPHTAHTELVVLFERETSTPIPTTSEPAVASEPDTTVEEPTPVTKEENTN